MIYLYIILVYYILKSVYVHRLRKQRDVLDLSTTLGRTKCRELNERIDFLNGAWIWNLIKKK